MSEAIPHFPTVAEMIAEEASEVFRPTINMRQVRVTAFDVLIADGLTYRVEFTEPVDVQIGGMAYQEIRVRGFGTTTRIATGEYPPEVEA